MTADEERYVAPFYLGMMGLNALSSGDDDLSSIAALGPRIPVATVSRLLRDAWRPRVMGAWFALFHGAMDIGEELRRSLETSAGSLTAPPLATVAATMLGTAALPSLQVYATIDAERGYGSAAFIAAVIEHLGETARHGSAGDEARAQVDGMLAVARRLTGV